MGGTIGTQIDIWGQEPGLWLDDNSGISGLRHRSYMCARAINSSIFVQINSRLLSADESMIKPIYVFLK